MVAKKKQQSEAPPVQRRMRTRGMGLSPGGVERAASIEPPPVTRQVSRGSKETKPTSRGKKVESSDLENEKLPPQSNNRDEMQQFYQPSAETTITNNTKSKRTRNDFEETSEIEGIDSKKENTSIEERSSKRLRFGERHRPTKNSPAPLTNVANARQAEAVKVTSAESPLALKSSRPSPPPQSPVQTLAITAQRLENGGTPDSNGRHSKSTTTSARRPRENHLLLTPKPEQHRLISSRSESMYSLRRRNFWFASTLY